MFISYYCISGALYLLLRRAPFLIGGMIKMIEKVYKDNLPQLQLCEEERKFLYMTLKSKNIPELKIRIAIAKFLNYIKSLKTI